MRFTLHDKHPFKNYSVGPYKASKQLVTLDSTVEELDNLLDKDPLLSGNQSEMRRSARGEESEWRGGSLEDAKKMPSMQPFFDAKERLIKSGVFKELSPILQNAPRRKRQMSEYDGDFDFDKRWEIKPFSQTARTKVPVPVIKILANMSINCQYSAGQINEYGALCWALVELIGSRGINVEVSFENYSFRSCDVTAKGQDYIDFYQRIVLKEATKYISPQAMAHVFRTSFVRRQSFSAIIHGADFAGRAVDSALGLAPTPDYVAQYKDGTLQLAIGALNDHKAVINALKDILITK